MPLSLISICWGYRLCLHSLIVRPNASSITATRCMVMGVPRYP